MDDAELTLAGQLATQLRVDSIRCSTEAGSGHPTSSLSAADLMAVLLVGHLRYDWDRPDLVTNDPPNLLERSRLATAVLDVPSSGGDRRC
jgi:transketolase